MSKPLIFPDGLDCTGILKGVVRQDIRLDCPFEQAARAFAGDRGTVLLLSGSHSDAARYHILALDPWLELSAKNDRVSLFHQKQHYTCRAEPFQVVQAVADRFAIRDTDIDLPVLSGLFGYFAYDLKDGIERLPVTCADPGLPDLVLFVPSIIVIQDVQSLKTQLLIPQFETQSVPRENGPETIQRKTDSFFSRLKAVETGGTFQVDPEGCTSSFTRDEYIRAVDRIIAYLKDGDIYQANLSQRFEAGFSGDAYSFFQDLYRRNPAAFFSYVNAGSHVIVSTSPERFIRQQGRRVETRPIKGTIARGADTASDKANRKKLEKSTKDDAELTMIVDLMRNDLSRVTAPGTVEVTEHRRLEPYANVFHLVSVITAELLPGKTSVDLIRATFPGGSITGCPKIRAMEIIDELEPVKRHVYTGSIGYISFHDTMDLSIAIRTATVSDGRIWFSVGGGIVYDSDPENEFQETLDKGKTLMETLGRGGKPFSGRQPVLAWVNGRMTRQDRAAVPLLSTGVQYGAGLFETLRVENKIAFRLRAHLDRLAQSWEALFQSPCPDVSWQTVIQRLVTENGFEDQTLAVKLMAMKGVQGSGQPCYLAALARPYTHRLQMLGKNGLDLITHPNPRQTPLADHKSLNYLYYERAGCVAKAAGMDEALILNPDQTVSETNTASIFALDGGRAILPASRHVLGGVTLGAVVNILEKEGFEIVREPVPRQDFMGLSDIMVTNALMGAVKVLTIDSKKIKQKQPDICSIINKALFRSEKNQIAGEKS